MTTTVNRVYVDAEGKVEYNGNRFEDQENILLRMYVQNKYANNDPTPFDVWRTEIMNCSFYTIEPIQVELVEVHDFEKDCSTNSFYNTMKAARIVTEEEKPVDQPSTPEEKEKAFEGIEPGLLDQPIRFPQPAPVVYEPMERFYISDMVDNYCLANGLKLVPISQQPTEWTPVSRELPKEVGQYLTKRANGIHALEHWYTNTPNTSEHLWLNCYMVTHYIALASLPEPPKP